MLRRISIRRNSVCALIAAFVATGGAEMWAQATDEAIADAYVSSALPNNNYGNGTVYTENSSTVTRNGYFKFDLSEYSSVKSALFKFRAHCSPTPALVATFYPVTDTVPSWVESSVTWNTRPARGSTAIGSANITSSFGDKQVDVASYIKSELHAGRTIISIASHKDIVGAGIIYIADRNNAGHPHPRLELVPNNLPTVTLTAPASGGSYAIGSTIAFTATASDPDGTVIKVEFLVDGAVVGEDLSSPYNFNWYAGPGTLGSRSITARAIDNDGAPKTSAAVTITIAEDDSDYDGIKNSLELSDGTDPFNANSARWVQLAHWAFNNTDWNGSAGQQPISGSAGYPVHTATWTSDASAANMVAGKYLTYKDVEADWSANINLRNGTLRFWFKPNWDGTWLRAKSGRVAHYSYTPSGADHERSFTLAAGSYWAVQEKLFQYVYIDPANVPQEIMLEWVDDTGGTAHRAYWGEDLINLPGRVYKGPIPAANAWQRLEALVSEVSMTGRQVAGMVFRTRGGNVKWDYTGTDSASTAAVWFDDGLPAGTTYAGPWDWGVGWARLFELGGYGQPGFWHLGFVPDGSQITLVAQGESLTTYPVQAEVNFKANRWYQIALTYTPSNSAFYINGQVVQAGTGVLNYPNKNERGAGLKIGHDGGSWQPNAHIAHIETYNYPIDYRTLTRDALNYQSAGNIVDSDNDGRTDFQELYVDGTNPDSAGDGVPVRLGYWRFNDYSLIGEEGQYPVWASAGRPASWSGKAVSIGSGHGVAYAQAEANGRRNVVVTKGSISFWFKPNWNTGQSGPTARRLIDLADSWLLRFLSGGYSVGFWCNPSDPPRVLANIQWTAGVWHHFVLTYSGDATELYLDGQRVAQGPGVYNAPSSFNFRIGSSGTDPSVWADGEFEELETFNYVLSSSQVTNAYERIRSVDRDRNGVADLLEDAPLPSASPFARIPFVVTGTIEAEQYDRGGQNVGYYSQDNHQNTTYRPSRAAIETSDDRGAGYCVSRLRVNDWLKYTFQVRRSGYYAVDVRAAPVVIGGSGGRFMIEFGQMRDGPGGFIVYNANTGPYEIQNSGWQTLTSQRVYLDAGTNHIRLVMQNDSTDGYAGRFNYLSVYPSVNEPDFSGLPVEDVLWWGAVNDGSYGDSAIANRDAFQAAIDYLQTLPSGGTLYVPAGTYVLAQAQNTGTEDPAWPSGLPAANYSVRVAGSRIRILGDGTNQTTLTASNRSLTIFLFDGGNSQSNIAVEGITFKGRPHIRPNGDYDAGAYSLATPTTSYGRASQLVLLGGSTPLRNVLVRNCKFLNSSCYGIVLGFVDGATFTGNQFVFWNGETGNDDGRVPMAPVGQPYSSTNPMGAVGLFGSSSYSRDIVFAGNYYNGNPNQHLDPNAYCGDGIIWIQGGGNWYVAGNTITNYGLEAVQFNSGPGTVVGNDLGTFPKNGSTCGLNGFAAGQPSLTVDDYQVGATVTNLDFTLYFVGNNVRGGRSAYFGFSAWTSYNEPLHDMHFTGNRVDLDGPGVILWDWPGAAVRAANCRRANIAGNTMVRGGYGVTMDFRQGEADILANDFGSAEWAGIVYDGPSSNVVSVLIAKNVLSSGTVHPPNTNPNVIIYPLGEVAHLKAPIPEIPGWFLIGNTLRDVFGGANALLLAPPSTPVHTKDQ